MAWGLKPLFWKLCNTLHKYIAKPRMVLGFKRADGVYLANTRISTSAVISYPEKLNIADNVYLSHYSLLECSNEISIAEGCQICAFVVITSHSSHRSIRLYGAHYIEHNGRHLGYVQGKIQIGKYCFIGPHSVIMPGTTIGKGCIVAAHSLVKGEFPDFAIIAGSPAQIVGDTRTTDAKLLAQYPHLQNYYQEWAED